MSDIAKVEQAIGYSFRNPDLLWQALTHKTYARLLNTPDCHNEWLALFGDTLLDLIVMNYLYQVHGSFANKDFLSDERDKIVKDDNLELLADQIQLRDFFLVVREEEPISKKHVTDSFEALLAAIYLDMVARTTIDEALGVVQVWFIDRFLGSIQVSGHTIDNYGLTIALPELEIAIGCVFDNKALLRLAVAEQSYAAKMNISQGDNQCFALLGDALLDFVVLEYLYQNRGNHGKGLLSTLRDLMVQDSVLKDIAEGLKLRNFIPHNGQIRIKSLTDGVEALLAAIYLDQGLAVARDWIFKLLPDEVMSLVEKRLGRKSISNQSSVSEMLAEDCLISEAGVDYEKLHSLLREGSWQAADQETKEAMLRVFGLTDYLPKELIEEFPYEDLAIIDRLWSHYSGDRFGFSVQVGILEKVDDDWTAFCDLVGWRVNGVWQPKGDRLYDLEAPMGHLPSAAIRAAGNGSAVRMRVLNRFAICISANLTIADEQKLQDIEVGSW
jgi:dsRNA-specific ribonuclease